MTSTTRAAWLALLLLLPLAVTLFQSSSASAGEEPKRVLLIFAEDHSLPLIVTLSQSIRSTLNDQSTSRLEFYTEHLDRARITGVQTLYNCDRELVEMGVESYLGMALRNATGQPFGLVSVMGLDEMFVTLRCHGVFKHLRHDRADSIGVRFDCFRSGHSLEVLCARIG